MKIYKLYSNILLARRASNILLSLNIDNYLEGSKLIINDDINDNTLLLLETLNFNCSQAGLLVPSPKGRYLNQKLQRYLEGGHLAHL